MGVSQQGGGVVIAPSLELKKKWCRILCTLKDLNLHYDLAKHFENLHNVPFCPWHEKIYFFLLGSCDAFKFASKVENLNKLAVFTDYYFWNEM